MRLLHYTYWKLFPFLLLLLTIWGTLFYLTILEEVTDETDDSLENYRNILVNTALQDSTILLTEGNLMTMYRFRPITEKEAYNYKDVYYDSTVYIQIEDEYEPVRVMKSCFRMPNGQYYELELKISTLEREDMIEAILYYLLALFVLMFVSMIIITRIVLKKAFNPLDKLMAWLRSIQPGREVPPLNNETSIKEFKELSNAAVDMGNRSYKAYNQQKQFIENASHELQTPLAIARNKIELLAENESLNEQQMFELDGIYATLGRAVKLNKSLLLLSKIENGQYVETETLKLETMTEEILNELTDIYEDKHIHLELKVNSSFVVECNKALLRILLTNLLKNAFVHNIENGKLIIEINSSSLKIKNSGSKPLDKNRIFQRFYRPESGYKDSVGLGLSISKSISTSFKLLLSYTWEEEMHCFILHK